MSKKNNHIRMEGKVNVKVTPALLKEIRVLLAEDQTISAIRLLRLAGTQVGGFISLRAAKNVIDYLHAGNRVVKTRNKNWVPIPIPDRSRSRFPDETDYSVVFPSASEDNQDASES